MLKNTIKKSIAMLAGALIIALVVWILPSGYFAEASKNMNTKAVGQKYITLKQAEEIALKKVNDKKAEIVEFEIELTEKIPNYEFEIVTEGHEYKIEINAISGEIIEYEKDTIDKEKSDKSVVDVKYITEKKAIEIALAKIGSKATLQEIDFEKNDNPPKYEIEMHDDKYEYEIEIHAITGAILEFERDED